MSTTRILPAVLLAALMISCADDASTDDASTDDNAPFTTTTDVVTTTTDVATTTITDAVTTTTSDVVTTTISATVEFAQPAIWPAADVAFAAPEEAAADFVTKVLGVEPVLGEFVPGDSRSGEIEVFSPGEATPVSRSLLLLRQLAPNDGWFVIGAVSPNATIVTPAPNSEIAAGALTVEGVARGHETTVLVTASLAGDADAVLDQVITSGGAFETPEPYSVTIDLTGASPGDVITLLVHGDTGLENDPGDFGAIPIVIGNGPSSGG